MSEIEYHYQCDPNYEYQVLDETHIPQTIEVMTTAFCDFEPMTQHLKVSYDEFRPFATEVIEKAVQDKLSVVALEGKKVVACAIVEDLVNPAPLDLEKLAPKFKHIFSLLESISGPFFSDKKIAPNHIAHLFITAVHNNYHRRGLSRQVNFQSMKVAAQRNFDLMISELTNYYNEKGTIKYIEYDKYLIGSCTYNQYCSAGEKPFEALHGSADSYLWGLHPKARLKYQKEHQAYEKSLLVLEPELVIGDDHFS